MPEESTVEERVFRSETGQTLSGIQEACYPPPKGKEKHPYPQPEKKKKKR